MMTDRFDFPESLIEHCLDPHHLPHYESYEDYTFIVLRNYDIFSEIKASTVRELTRKVAIFIKENLIITVHRHKQLYLEHFHQRILENKVDSKPLFLKFLIQSVLSSFEEPIQVLHDKLEIIEESIFNQQGIDPGFLQQKFLTKRKADVFAKMLMLSHDILARIKPLFKNAIHLWEDLEAYTKHLHVYAEDLSKHSTSSIELQISLSTHNTNQVMKTLTIFSVFFMPLTYIVGIYGMNFQFMPELSWPYGYFVCMGIQAVICLLLWRFFGKKHWIHQKNG